MAMKQSLSMVRRLASKNSVNHDVVRGAENYFSRTMIPPHFSRTMIPPNSGEENYFSRTMIPPWFKKGRGEWPQL